MEKSRALEALDREAAALDLWELDECTSLDRRLRSIDEIRDWDRDWWYKEVGLLLIEFRAKEKTFSDKEEYEYAARAKGLADRLQEKLLAE